MPRHGRYKREEDKPLSSINFGYNAELERNRKACKALSESLPDNAFADDVVDDESGHYYHKETHITMGWSTLGEYEKGTKDY